MQRDKQLTDASQTWVPAGSILILHLFEHRNLKFAIFRVKHAELM